MTVQTGIQAQAGVAIVGTIADIMIVDEATMAHITGIEVAAVALASAVTTARIGALTDAVMVQGMTEATMIADEASADHGMMITAAE
jgi:hypothetical protein